MFPAKVLHESSGSYFGPYLLSDQSRVPVWYRIGASVVENSHGGVSKQDNGVPIDTVAVPNWCFLPRCCTNRVAATLDLTYYPINRGYQFGTGLGRQWLRIRMEEFRNRTMGSRLTPWPFRTGVSCQGAARIEWQLLWTLPTIRSIEGTSLVQDWGVSG